MALLGPALATERSQGLFGLNVRGLRRGAYATGEDMSVPIPAEWPELRVATRTPAPADSRNLVEERRAEMAFAGKVGFVLDRDEGLVTFSAAEVLSDDALLHPYLGLPAAVMNRWHGRSTFHAGGIEIGGAVWGILGGPGAGKSTTLAWLMQQGLRVFTDDLFVLDGLTVFAGPRCLDLREDASLRLGLGRPLGVVGSRERWRVQLGPAPIQAQLAGWIHLGSASEPACDTVPPAERISRLCRHEALGLGPTDPTSLLDLVALPSWEWRRPLSWEDMGRATDELLDAIG